MNDTSVIEKVKCHFCHKQSHIDPNKPMFAQGWHLHFWGPGEYWICDRCSHQGKIRCPSCGEEAQKLWTGYDDYEIRCAHCDSQF